MEGTRKAVSKKGYNKSKREREGAWRLVGNKNFKKQFNFCEHKIFGQTFFSKRTVSFAINYIRWGERKRRIQRNQDDSHIFNKDLDRDTVGSAFRKQNTYQTSRTRSCFFRSN